MGVREAPVWDVAMCSQVLCFLFVLFAFASGSSECRNVSARLWPAFAELGSHHDVLDMDSSSGIIDVCPRSAFGLQRPVWQSSTANVTGKRAVLRDLTSSSYRVHRVLVIIIVITIVLNNSNKCN